MIVDDIRQAQQRHDKAHILTLLHVLHHFLKSHPEVRPSQHPWTAPSTFRSPVLLQYSPSLMPGMTSMI
jgi:hypothetical protein